MRIMITGGGTGGHTSPAVAIIEELRKRDPRLAVQWVGCRNGIEERVARHHDIPFRSVPVEGWPRGRSLRKLWAAAKLAFGVVRALLYVLRFHPQAVIGVGGYVSLPLCLAAQRLDKPTILHEQNKRLGMANQLLAPRATRLLLSYPETLGEYPKDKAAVVGNPVRAAFAAPPEKRAARNQLDADIPVILVSGGSQGAHTINQAMMDAVPQFGAEEIQILWMTGKADAAEARTIAEAARARVDTFTFIDDMVTACAAADLMVGRAGASSTAEIAMLGKPSILIPFAHATDNHQHQNALAFKEAGAAILLDDADCTGDTLAHLLRETIADPARLEAMAQAAGGLARPTATSVIVEEILLLAFKDRAAGAA